MTVHIEHVADCMSPPHYQVRTGGHTYSFSSMTDLRQWASERGYRLTSRDAARPNLP